MNTESRSIDQLAQYWATNPIFDDKTRDEIAQLIEDKDERELTERFYRDLEFGTGGLRGIIGAGSARMNLYNVRKAGQALANYILKQSDDNTEESVAIAYDSRHYSRAFAEAIAEVLAANKIKAYITKKMRPVPMLSYMVRYFKCRAGVCVTASHNPPNYNGCKIYWRDGAQVVAPHDQAIIDEYEAISDYASIKHEAFAQGVDNKRIIEVGAELDEAYYNELKPWVLNKDGRENFKVVFTPLHGSALEPVMQALKLFGFDKVTAVPEQSQPDGAFPTVKSPNPEDPEALSMALALAKQQDADLILGTDPDGDRLGMIYRSSNKDYKLLNGNQIGTLLMDYVLASLKKLKRLPENAMVIKTIVTTDLQNAIAAEHGAHMEETLTGFKWICKVIDEYDQGTRTPYREYICGGEESYGFLAGHFVRDKDGVMACCLAAEMCAFYKSQGKDLGQVLNDIFRRHGVYQEELLTLTLPGKDGAEKITAMMERLRHNPPRSLDGVDVVRMRDLKIGKEFIVNSSSTEAAQEIALPASNVLQFLLQDGTKVSARPSGTEPKIKFYVSVREPIASDTTDDALKQIKARCQKRVQAISNIIRDMAG